MDNPDKTSQFIDLYTRHETRLRGLALSLVSNWADAAEVFQQSSLVLWRNFDSFEMGTNFFAWASKIVYRQAKDFRKSMVRRKAHLSEDVLELVAARTVELASKLDERQWALDRCLSKLCADHRRLLQLRYDEGRTIESVAEALGRSVEAVYKTLARVRKALWDCVNRTLQLEGLS